MILVLTARQTSIIIPSTKFVDSDRRIVHQLDLSQPIQANAISESVQSKLFGFDFSLPASSPSICYSGRQRQPLFNRPQAAGFWWSRHIRADHNRFWLLPGNGYGSGMVTYPGWGTQPGRVPRPAPRSVPLLDPNFPHPASLGFGRSSRGDRPLRADLHPRSPPRMLFSLIASASGAASQRVSLPETRSRPAKPTVTK